MGLPENLSVKMRMDNYMDSLEKNIIQIKKSNQDVAKESEKGKNVLSDT